MKRYRLSMPHDFNLFLIGDDHEGTILRDDTGWSKMCDMVNSEYEGLPEDKNYIVHHGDWMEGILIDDYRFDALTTKDTFVTRQKAEAKKNFWPIKEKLITILDGNHTDKLRKYGDLTRELCEVYLDRPEIYGTWSAHITYTDKDGNVLFKHFATHGNGRINSVAGDILQRMANLKVLLKRRIRDKFGDVLLASMGHTHKLIICPAIGAIPDMSFMFLKAGKEAVEKKYTRVEKTDGYIHPDFRWYVNTGCFLNWCKDMPAGQEISGYAEKKNYDPLESGFAVCLIRDGRLVNIKEEIV